jgi:ABC-type Fe3+ transport system permease subunit
MSIEIPPFQFQIDITTLAGISLWSLALYLAFFPLSEWVMEKLGNWMNQAERSLYSSEAEFDKTQAARESMNAFYASLLSVVPFLVFGILCNWGVAESLGRSWTISMGIIAAIGCGVYELGRRDGQSAK